MTKQPRNKEPTRQAQESEKDDLKSPTWPENTGEFIAAVEHLFDGIMTSDMEKNVRYVNQAYAAMHVYSTEEMIGMKAENFHDFHTKNLTGGRQYRQSKTSHKDAREPRASCPCRIQR